MAQQNIRPGSTPRLISIEYPAVVEDEEKALRCLGGLDVVNQVIQDPSNRRLELRFRPDDVFAKPTCTVPKEAHALVLKVKRRTKKNSSEPPELTTELLGVVDKVFTFENMCDFQYLPADESGKSVYDAVVPGSLLDVDYVTRSAPLFVPPVAFSRMDAPQSYCFRRPPNTRPLAPGVAAAAAVTVSEGGRKRRRYGAQAVTHMQSELPEQPLVDRETFESQVRQRGLTADLEQLRKLFQERPVMSRAYIYYRLQGHKDRLKYLLPLVAYYFNTGPWRNMWTRLGYDPRTDPDAWKYQIIDYRTRSTSLRKKMVLKRALSAIPYRSGTVVKNRLSLIGSRTLQEATSSKDKDTAGCSDCEFAFRPGMVPVARQIFYQYCDIDVPEVTAVLADARSGEYTASSGWMKSGVDEKVRDIITANIGAYLASIKTAGGTAPQETEAEDYLPSDPDTADEQDSAEDDDDVEDDETEGGAAAGESVPSMST